MLGPQQVLLMLAGRWGRSLAGWAVASAIIWYLFPLFPPLRPVMPRLIAIVAVLVILVGVNAVLSWRRRRRTKALATAMTGEAGGEARESEAEATEEVARLRERMTQALARLGRRGRGRHIYEQPWFVLIGPPGSGKTTALLNSGLHFPFARDEDSPAIRGVGGTRLCDWWFADEAVLIDTAGRYTTQDSDAAVDRAGWQGFLDLLRKTRPRQPINGVIVVLSLVDLASADLAERAAHARSVRLRINEITARLQLRVPVYVVLSKADRLHGFDAYFDDLDTEGREQVWGMTFPLDATVEAFGREFRLLLGRLQERLVERLQAERAGERRALIGGFPLQVASLDQPLTEFLTQAFAGSRLDPPPLLRGVYFTSATQEGTPIDRLTGMLARSFGVDRKRLPSLRPVSGRSYFVARMLREVILGEALLVTSKPGRMRRRRILRAAGFAAVGLATLVGGVLLWRADSGSRIAVEQASEQLAAYRQSLAGVTLDPVSDDDLDHAAPLLDAAAALPQGDGGWAANLFGLSQQAKLAQSNRLVYQHTLQDVLLPRLVRRLEQQMHSQFDDPAFLYEATRVYLMLGSAGPLDPGLVRDWMRADWQVRYPGTLNTGLRADLLTHLNALLEAPLPAITLDGALVEAARATFSRVSLAERVYSRIRGQAGTAAVPDWTPAEALGPSGAQLFARVSRRPLAEGIPGFFTAAGFHDVLLRDLAATAREVAGESWVLGHAEQIPTDGPQVVGLEQAVVALYFADAQKRWDALLGDLALARFGNREAMVQELYVLSSPQSPMRDLLTAIAQGLRLDSTPAATDGKPGQGPHDAQVAALFSATPAEAAPAPSAALRTFEAHYQPLVDLVASGGHAPIDNVLHLVNALQQELAAATPGATAVPATLQGSGDPVQLLLAEADRQPVPVSRWLRQIADGGNVMLGSAAQAAASAAFAGSDGPQELCRSVVDGHYPFDPASRQDAPIDDFTRLFAPGGTLDSYYQAQIKPYVDTRGAVWRAHALGGVRAPVDAATVASFQHAAAIRDVFFPVGGGQPQIRFTLTAAAGNGTKATLTLGSASIATDAGRPVTFTWPGADGMNNAALVFSTGGGSTGGSSSGGGAPGKDPAKQPANPVVETALQENGPWALFRLLAAGRLQPEGSPDTYALSFATGGEEARFKLQAGSSHNPFGHDVFAGFKCPVVR
jgi:type VI secretion system protein ImpL